MKKQEINLLSLNKFTKGKKYSELPEEERMAIAKEIARILNENLGNKEGQN